MISSAFYFLKFVVKLFLTLLIIISFLFFHKKLYFVNHFKRTSIDLSTIDIQGQDYQAPIGWVGFG